MLLLRQKETRFYGSCINLIKERCRADLRFFHLNFLPYLTARFKLQSRTETIKETIDLIFFGNVKFSSTLHSPIISGK